MPGHRAVLPARKVPIAAPGGMCLLVHRNGRVALRLVNGNEIPVSHSFAPALRDRGWL